LIYQAFRKLKARVPVAGKVMRKERLPDAAEEVVHRLLSGMGFENIAPEPDGNVTPDFVIDGRIAVEVRRLIQIHYDGSKPQDLSVVAFPFSQQVENLLNSIEGNGQGSWWVSVAYRRPMPPWKQLRPQLRQALEAFILSPDKRSRRIYETPNVDMEVHEASIPLKRFFVLVGNPDYDAGGAVVAEFLKSINYCIDEKSRKVAASGSKHKYEEWWLALVNYTGMALDDRDRGQLLENLEPHPDWDKVLIVTASDPPKYFEC
jgi:hypothetical protein